MVLPYHAFQKGFFHNIVATSTNGKVHVSFSGLVSGFFTFFFALGGIEYLASSAGDLKDGQNNVIKGISITMLIAVVGHLLLTTITKGALGPNRLSGSGTNLQQNPINEVFLIAFGSVGGIVMIYIYAIIRIVSEANSRLSVGWTAARVIEPLASDGFLPFSWARRNRHQQLSRGILSHSVMSGLILAGILIPLLIYRNNSQTLAAPFQIYTVVAFVQYLGVLSAASVLLQRGKVKAPYVYFFLAPVVIVALSVSLVLYLYSTIEQGMAGDVSQYIVLGSSIGVMALAIPIFLLGKISGIHKKGWNAPLQKQAA